MQALKPPIGRYIQYKNGGELKLTLIACLIRRVRFCKEYTKAIVQAVVSMTMVVSMAMVQAVVSMAMVVSTTMVVRKTMVVSMTMVQAVVSTTTVVSRTMVVSKTMVQAVVIARQHAGGQQAKR